MELISDRLVLREVSDEDLIAINDYSSDEENVVYMTFAPNSIEDTKKFIDLCKADSIQETRMNYDLAVYCKTENKVIGTCGMYVDSINEVGTNNVVGYQGEIGWILNKKYWKNGYGVEIAKRLIKFGFEEKKLHRIIAKCNAENYASYRVMEKSGMRFETLEKKSTYGRVRNVKIWYDKRIYAILDEDYFKI
ncbi:MAG: GNAT family N-acetyltransferase [Clostridia bacterium]